MKVTKSKRLLWKAKYMFRKTREGLLQAQKEKRHPLLQVMAFASVTAVAQRIQNTPADLFGPSGIDKRRARRQHRKQKALFKACINLPGREFRITTPAKEQIANTVEQVKAAFKDSDSQVIILGEDAE